MINILTATVIALFVLIEIDCGMRLISYALERSDERSEARREKFRVQAYKDMNERWSLKKNRQELWLSIRK
ncbi:MAG: hypothetical protein NC485_03995 [Ruminococcus flavefaciens]|nr:hypothetical protein [Ruminococcus flavefaciens]MCM1062584.1 hypothetical protein [Eubacterium sp.]